MNHGTGTTNAVDQYYNEQPVYTNIDNKKYQRFSDYPMNIGKETIEELVCRYYPVSTIREVEFSGDMCDNYAYIFIDCFLEEKNTVGPIQEALLVANSQGEFVGLIEIVYKCNEYFICNGGQFTCFDKSVSETARRRIMHENRRASILLPSDYFSGKYSASDLFYHAIRIMMKRFIRKYDKRHLLEELDTVKKLLQKY